MSSETIYLDYQATTPVDPRILTAMLPFFTHTYANPSSPHRLGKLAAAALRTARRQVRVALGARYDSEIVFASGATEANHLAITGSVPSRPRQDADQIVTTAIEHHSVLAACQRLADAGYAVTTINAGSDGVVDPADIAAAITPGTALVSVMYANNEIGTIQPISDIAAIARTRGVPLHVDAVQAIGAIDINVEELGVDLLTISAHKIYGPKGVGALYTRRGTPLRPHYPGSQEHGTRAGTANLPAIVGLAEALHLLDTERAGEASRLARLRDDLADALVTAIPHVRVNGSRVHRLPGNLSITIPGVDAAELIDTLPDLAISTGSACTSGQAEPSHVLVAIGLEPADARSTIRLSLGRQTHEWQIHRAAGRITTEVARLRGNLPTA